MATQHELDVKFPVLCLKYRILSEKVMGMILPIYSQGAVVMKQIPKVKFNGDTGLSVSYESTIDLNGLLTQRDTIIIELSEFKEVEEELNKCGMPRNYGIQPRVFLLELIKRNQGYKFDADIFNQIYKEYETFLVTKKAKHRSRVFLEHFQTDAVVLNIDANITLKKFNEEEFADVITNTFSYSQHKVLHLRHCIDLDYDVIEEGDFHKKHEEAKHLLTNVLYCMRLFKGGNISGIEFSRFPLSWSSFGGRIGSIDPISESRAGGSNYVLNVEEESSFRKYWEKYKHDFSKYQFLNIAINRFNSAFNNQRFEDRLIDFMISFEALYLTGQEQQELKYRLALRTAHNLFDEIEVKKQVFRDMKNAYDLRSSIVHGKNYEDKNILKHYKSINDFIYQVENYLRLSLNKFISYLEGLKSQEEIINCLDEKILS